MCDEFDSIREKKIKIFMWLFVIILNHRTLPVENIAFQHYNNNNNVRTQMQLYTIKYRKKMHT